MVVRFYRKGQVCYSISLIHLDKTRDWGDQEGAA